MSAYTPGYGDAATWPSYAGHPNDPRAPSDEDIAILWANMKRSEKVRWLVEEYPVDELAELLLDATGEAMP